MNKVLIASALAISFLSGCASVPSETPENESLAKQFNRPSEGNAGIYIYRAGGPGGAIKKDVWIDGKCIGETAPHVFFYEEVGGDEEHKISTESEFSPNDLLVKTDSGKNYYVNQYMKMGVFVGGAAVEIVDEDKGKAAVSKAKMAIKGNCSK
jgi:hypothetical protein